MGAILCHVLLDFHGLVAASAVEVAKADGAIV